MKKFLLCLAAALLPLFAVCADTFYVSADGKADNDGSDAHPWASVGFALSKAGGGHTIIVTPGVYRGPIAIGTAFAGTKERPTVIKSEAKWKAVVIGSETHGIWNGGHCDWLVVDGFEVLGARFDGVKLSGDHNTVRNCWVHHNTQMGVAMHGIKDGVIENNLIEFNGCHVQFDHGVYADGDGLTNQPTCRTCGYHRNKEVSTVRAGKWESETTPPQSSFGNSSACFCASSRSLSRV